MTRLRITLALLPAALRRWLALLLVLPGIVTGGPAMMGAQALAGRGAHVVVICSGHGTRTVTLDRNGNPLPSRGGVAACGNCCIIAPPVAPARVPVPVLTLAHVGPLPPAAPAPRARRLRLRPPLRAPPGPI